MKKAKILSAFLSLTLGMTSLAAVPMTTIIAADTMIGDVNRDSIIDGIDATAVLTYYAVASTGGKVIDNGFNAEYADYNEDGVIDGRDATDILSYYAKQSVSAGKLGLRNEKITKVRLLPAPIDIAPEVSGDQAKPIIDYLSGLTLYSDFEGDPIVYGFENIMGPSCKIQIRYEDGNNIEIHQVGNKYISSAQGKWYALNEEQGQRLYDLISEMNIIAVS